MKCSLCGFIFNENDAKSSCGGCGLVKKCEMVRCPHCNFEMAPDPEWLKKLRNARRKINVVR